MWLAVEGCLVTDRRSDQRGCALCGAPLPGSGSGSDPGDSSVPTSSVYGSAAGPTGQGEGDPDERYCSTGCRDVDRTLESPSSKRGADGPGEGGAESLEGRTAGGDNGTDAGTGEGTPIENDGDEPQVRTFFRVDGMHSATCEAFLDSVAQRRDGVADAAASYVTETVRVDHDPARISTSDLRDALSTVGYTAYLRSAATADSVPDGATDGERGTGTEDAKEDGEYGPADDTGSTHRSREMTGLRKRRSDTMLEVRYIVGIVFGSFLLVPYFAVLYPVYLSSFVDGPMLARYEDAFAGFDGLLVLPLFLVVSGVVLYLTGGPLLRGAYVSLKLRRPNTHLLAALTILAGFAYGTLSIFRGRIEVYYDLTIVVAALVMGAVFYEATVKRRARDRLTDLTISQVDTARVYGSGQDSDGKTASGKDGREEGNGNGDGTATGPTRTVPIGDLEGGERLLVREGERIPVDGVLETACTVDEAVVTGESLPISKAEGDPVVGGSVVRSGAAVVDVGAETTSSIDRLTEAVWNLQSATHGVQRRADSVAAVLAPLVVAAAVAVGVTTLFRGGTAIDAAEAIMLSIIVASPWALGFATPASVGAGLREALDHGIVVFDETVLERLRDVDVVVFDKTGTLTTGEMSVLEAEGPPDLLAAAGELERRASHPVAVALADAFAADEPGDGEFVPDGGDAAVSPRVEAFDGLETGVAGRVDGSRILVGHPDLFRDRGWTLESDLEERVREERGFGRLPVVVGRDGRAQGFVVVGDEPRADWDDALSSLGERELEVVVLTGDDEAATAFFAAHPAVDHAFAGVPPDGKTATIHRLKDRGQVAMVGDGTNDAPALAAADLGISLGGATALAADAADLAIVEDTLPTVERAFELAVAARRRVRGTLALALCYNAVVLPAAVLGVLNPLVTTAAVAVTAVLVAGNAARPLLE
ncbi:ATPase P [Halobiforma lacisalsi AJ5]|uniref:ATPase P n=1 Tax=Natronobacterium lacisalsi AJ5 TaxID=358396 RepID=A0A1P8LKN5_NATLA|nr:ATPase P [Halobiforma lacisalsi AJ5]